MSSSVTELSCQQQTKQLEQPELVVEQQVERTDQKQQEQPIEKQGEQPDQQPVQRQQQQQAKTLAHHHHHDSTQQQQQQQHRKIPRWTELMIRNQKQKNLFRLGQTKEWVISVQPNRTPAQHGLRMVVHDKQTQHKLAYVLLTTNRSSNSMTTSSSLMGIFIDPKHRSQGLTRRILSVWLQWCMYVDLQPQTEIIRKPLLCCVLEHSLGFVTMNGHSCLPVDLVQHEDSNKCIHLYSVPNQCLRGVFSARDVQREQLVLHCSTCCPEQTCEETLVKRRIHLNGRFQRILPWTTLPDDPILETTLRPDQLRLILLGPGGGETKNEASNHEST